MNRPMYYVLDGHTPIPTDDPAVFSAGFDRDRRVALDTIGDAEISTVFLGLDHQWNPDGPPLLFETMVFGNGSDLVQRYSTWEAAEAGHAAVVRKYRRRSR